MACMTPAAPETRISILDPEAVAFRAGIIEGMMLNHPHDCPVCDEGGECHLQDMTVMTGHDYRRARFQKRTFRNQYLGPFVYHEMNRCIQCYRCVRFYRQYAGGNDLNAFGIKYGLTSAATKTAFSKTSSRAIWWRFARRVFSPIARCGTTTRANGISAWRHRSASTAAVGCNITSWRALWIAAPGREPIQQRGERLFPLRPWPLRLRIRQQRRTEFAPRQLDGEPISAEAAERELQSLISQIETDRLASARRGRRLRPISRCGSLLGQDRFFAGVESKEWTTDYGDGGYSQTRARPFAITA